MNPKKILIADDDRVFLKAMSLKLKSEGFEVLTAEDGGSAVSAVRIARPDLILLDINFPPDVGHGGGVPWDGFLIMNWLKRMEEAKNIPIVVVTGGDAAQLRDRAMASGAVGFFQKPVDNDELIELIRRALEGPTAPSAPPP